MTDTQPAAIVISSPQIPLESIEAAHKYYPHFQENRIHPMGRIPGELRSGNSEIFRTMNSRKVKDFLWDKLQVACPLCSLVRILSGRKRINTIHEKHLAFVIPLDDLGADLATQIQIGILEEYGHHPVIEAIPHITLKMGFAATDIRPFEKYLSELASEVATFDISIRNFGSFEEGILFLDVKSNLSLEKLRQRILKDLSEQFGIIPDTVEGPEFHYHVTLARDFTKSEFSRLSNAYKSREFHFNFTASHIDLFYHTGKQWVTFKRVPLLGINQLANNQLSNAAFIP